jgi:triacylglycerol esterase/lipase EstA (alpha/beta hydrolase family)
VQKNQRGFVHGAWDGLNFVANALDGGEWHGAILNVEPIQNEFKRIDFLSSNLKKTSIDSRQLMNYIV